MNEIAKVITLQQLKDKNACQKSLKIFMDNFCDQVIISDENAIKYGDLFRYDYTWIVNKFLNEQQRKEFEENRQFSLIGAITPTEVEEIEDEWRNERTSFLKELIRIKNQDGIESDSYKSCFALAQQRRDSISKQLKAAEEKIRQRLTAAAIHNALLFVKLYNQEN